MSSSLSPSSSEVKNSATTDIDNNIQVSIVIVYIITILYSVKKLNWSLFLFRLVSRFKMEFRLHVSVCEK